MWQYLLGIVLLKMFVLLSFASCVTNCIFQGTMRNMTSLALAGLITDFFYTGPSALGNLFPDQKYLHARS